MARDRTYKPVINSKKYQITQDEIDSIRADARHAQELLENPYLTSYFANAKKNILEIHAKQSLCDSTEESDHNGVKRTMKFPAKKEYTLLAGQYRFMETLVADLEQTVLIGQELDKKINSEELEVKADE